MSDQQPGELGNMQIVCAMCGHVFGFTDMGFIDSSLDSERMAEVKQLMLHAAVGSMADMKCPACESTEKDIKPV